MSGRRDDFAALLAEARAGSREALGEVLQACRLYLLSVADHEIDGPLLAKGGASDLVQETFLDAQRDFSRFLGASEAELLAWLRRLLLNNVANFARNYRDAAKRRLDREVALLPDGSQDGLPAIAADSPSPSERLIADEQTEELRRAIQRLPEEYRQVMHLRYERGLSFEEIGTTMNRSANAARKLWARAVESLEAEIGKQHG